MFVKNKIAHSMHFIQLAANALKQNSEAYDEVLQYWFKSFEYTKSHDFCMSITSMESKPKLNINLTISPIWPYMLMFNRVLLKSYILASRCCQVFP